MTQRRNKSGQSPSRTPQFRSSIPAAAHARVAHRHASGAPERVEYLVGRAVVGYRLFDADGELLLEAGVHRGRRHGREYRLDVPGKLLSATAYENGLEHGVARQWSDDGRLIGTYDEAKTALEQFAAYLEQLKPACREWQPGEAPLSDEKGLAFDRMLTYGRLALRAERANRPDEAMSYWQGAERHAQTLKWEQPTRDRIRVTVTRLDTEQPGVSSAPSR
jgi:hypothetical protein